MSGICDPEVRRETGVQGVGAAPGAAAQTGVRVGAGRRERVRAEPRERVQEVVALEAAARVHRLAGRDAAAFATEPDVRAAEVREVDRERRRTRARSEIRERLTASGGDVGVKVGLRLPVLVDEPVLEDVHLVEVVGSPLLAVAGADVADFERRPAADRALEPDRPRIRIRDLEVRVEDIHAAAGGRLNRIGRRLRDAGRGDRARANRRRTEVAIPEEERQRSEVAVVRVAVGVDRQSWVAAKHAREVRHAVTFERARPPEGERGVSRLAEDLLQEPAVSARGPVHADARRDVVPVGAVRVAALFEVLVGRGGARQVARLEQVAGCERRVAQVALRTVAEIPRRHRSASRWSRCRISRRTGTASRSADPCSATGSDASSSCPGGTGRAPEAGLPGGSGRCRRSDSYSGRAAPCR